MYAGVGWRRRSWKVPEAAACVGVGSGGKIGGRFRRWWHGCEGSGRFQCGLLPCNLDRSSRVIVLITGITLSTWAKRRHGQRWHKA